MWNMTLAHSEERDTGVGVLDRAVAVLDAVEAGARTFTEIVEVTGFSRTTTHRLVRSLVDHELIALRGGYGYRLGPRLLRFAQRAMMELPLRDIAHPFLERLAEMTGESAQLYVRSGLERVCIDAVPSARELRTIVPIGASLPLTAGSAGKVILAFDHFGAPAERLINEEFKWTDATPVGEDLRRQLAMIPRRGWAASSGERQVGVGSVSAPVFGPFGEFLAAISVSGPGTRLGRIAARRYAPAVVATAREIRGALTP
jgi:DNA-binding IclR family transcriptional regulator